MSETQEVVQVFKARREIAVRDKDGNLLAGKQVYEAEGATQAEADQKLIDKMSQAVEHGTRHISELRLKVKNGGVEIKLPEGAELDEPLPDPKPQQLSADEVMKLAQELQNPATTRDAFRKLYKAETGYEPMEDARVRKRRADDEATNAAVNETKAFTREHPELVTCKRNQQAFIDYISARKMKWTKKNLEMAYGDLKADGLLVLEVPEEPAPIVVAPPAPPATVPEPVETRTEAAVEPERRPDRFPSAIRPSQTSGSEQKPKRKGPSPAEIAMMNADQLKALYESQGLWGK